jgi:hypothetical protein
MLVGRVAGHVAGLWRYPVKSMAAEPLREVEVFLARLQRGSSLGVHSATVCRKVAFRGSRCASART